MSINPAYMPMTMGGGYNSLVAGLSPLLWYKMNEAATPAINYGSVASVDGVVSNMTFQVSGPNATIPLAYRYNGTTSLVASPMNASLNSAEWTIAMLLKPASSGEGTTGYFFDTQDASANAFANFGFNGSVSAVNSVVRDTTAGSGSTTISAGLTVGTWAWLFCQLKSSDKKFYAWRSVSSVLTEYTYATQVAVPGTPRQIGRVFVGNRSNSANTQDADYAQFMLFGSLLTTTQMQSIITASGV